MGISERALTKLRKACNSLLPWATFELVPKTTAYHNLPSLKIFFSFIGCLLPYTTLLGVLSWTHLFLLMIHVIDEQDAVAHSVTPSELLKCHSHIHPFMRLPISPPLQHPSFNPN